MKLSKMLHIGPKMRVRRRRFGRPGGEEGATLVEFAVVAVGLGTFLVGIVYGGINFYDYAVLTNAVAAGASTIATNRGSSSNVCTLGENALKSTAFNLNQSAITIDQGAGTEVFTGGGGSTCTTLQAGDQVTVTATYPCSMYFSKLGINLCSVAQGLITSTSGVTNGDTIGNCPSPYAYCIVSTTTVRIE